METDMPCPKCGNEYIKVGDKRVCPKDGHVAGYQTIDIVKVLEDYTAVRKMLEDICECQKDRDELIEAARKLLQTL